MFPRLFFRSVLVLLVSIVPLLQVTSPVFAAPPTNDDFDNAPLVRRLPYTTTANTSEATAAPDDPLNCYNNGSVWYAFRPRADVFVEANTFGSDYDTTLAAYTGRRGALTMVLGACNDDFSSLQSRVRFTAQAGVTYYFMVGVCCGNGGSGGGNLTFTLQEVEPGAPNVDLYMYPSEPSIYDDTHFYSGAWDPEGLGIESWQWDWGDGGTASGESVTHRYAVDGDYTIRHSVTTVDGRSATVTRLLTVKTRDVAITSFTRPRSAREGQVRKLVIGLSNKRYPETVVVDLYRSVPGGFEWFGSHTQGIPVRMGQRTTDIYFNYAFTQQDAEIGKVVFKAVVYLQNGRDALPADNEFISFAVKVQPRITATDGAVDAANTIDIETQPMATDYISNPDGINAPVEEREVDTSELNQRIFIPLVTR